jgi:DNA-binding MarR family transcriptional regulator
MKIHELLHKDQFKSPMHKLRVNLLYSAHWLNNKICDFLEPFGITQQQFNILRILRGQYPDAISTRNIRQRMIISGSDTSRLVDRLLSKRLVEKKICKHDKRKVDVVISEAGLELLTRIDHKINELDQVFGLTPAEADSLNQLLLKMHQRDSCQEQ